MQNHTAPAAAVCPILRIAAAGLALLVTFGLPLTFVTASGVEDSPAAAVLPPQLTADDLGIFLDGLIPVLLRRDDIAGAVIAVVKDGKLLLARGYGYSDVEAKKPVSPDSTLFRPGSISKLFTCTAVMQLVEQGKLDLDRDINQYLEFQIPTAYSQPITLRHLLTHTAGFQETIRGIFIRDGDRLSTLREYVEGNLPPRIFAPGTTPAYSNYGNALAGYIVERVSGQSFEEYIEEHIFRPLGMKHSTYRQPLPDDLKPLMSNGYQGGGSDPARPFEVLQTFPGGGMSTTAEDMSHFMIAHLQDGAFDNERILKPETARIMHSRQVELVASMNGSAVGFAEQTRNGYRAIGHGGDLQAFHSQLYLVPELRLGFFFSQNSTGRASLRTTIWRSFFDRYFPSAQRSIKSSNTPSNASELAGFYKTTRRFDQSTFKLGSLTGQVRVFANSDGTIRSDLINDLGRPKTLYEVEPMKYCEEKGEDCIAFRKDEGGGNQIVVDFPHIVFQRVPWYENRTLNYVLLGASVAVFALTVVFWPVGAVIRRHYGRRLDLTRRQRRLRVMIRIVCIVDLAFLIVGRILSLKLPDVSLEIWVHLLQAAGIVGALASLIVIYDAVRCWTEHGRWWASRVSACLIALACLGFVWFALVWHLFDFTTRY